MKGKGRNICEGGGKKLDKKLTASSGARTRSMGESVPHSVITPPEGPWISPIGFSISSTLLNLYFNSSSMSSLVAPSCFNRNQNDIVKEKEDNKLKICESHQVF